MQLSEAPLKKVPPLFEHYLLPSPRYRYREGLNACQHGRRIVQVQMGIRQSPKNVVGAVALLNGKFLRVGKVFARIYNITHKI